MAVAADVPARFDVVINGQGYILLNTVDPSLPFRVQRGTYGFSPTFLTRQNVGSAYGDNQQDFFLTASQNDFSLGSAQRFFRAGDVDRVRRFWADTNVDPVSVPGNVSLRNTMPSLGFSQSIQCLSEVNVSNLIYAAGTSNLYTVSNTGAITDKGAHGLGATPSPFGITTDGGTNVYLTTTSAGTVGIRKYSGTAFSTFSATGADSLAFLNNTLYGYSNTLGALVKYDTVGNQSTLFTWKDAAGNALTGSAYNGRLRAYGGKLLVMRKLGVRGRAELYQYDNTGVSQVAEFPGNFVGFDMEVVAGIVFVSGYLSRNNTYTPAIYYFVNNTVGLLWRSQTQNYTSPNSPSICAYGDGLAFTDDSTGNLMQYNIAVGGVHAMSGYTSTSSSGTIASANDFVLHTRLATTGYYFPSSSVTSSGTLITSLVDFENSLIKYFRGVKVEFDTAASATVDIAYQLDSLDGSWTNLQVGATSGTEYTFPNNISGHSVGIRFTLNKGTTAGPVLKRWYVRAAPSLQAYRKDEFIIDLTGRNGKTMVYLRDLTPSPLDGLEMCTNLRTAVMSTTPVSVTDRFGTYNALFEPENSDFYEIRPEEFVARVHFREV